MELIGSKNPGISDPLTEVYTVVDKMMGGVTEIINETSKQVQAGVLQKFDSLH